MRGFILLLLGIVFAVVFTRRMLREPDPPPLAPVEQFELGAIKETALELEMSEIHGFVNRGDEATALVRLDELLRKTPAGPGRVEVACEADAVRSLRVSRFVDPTEGKPDFRSAQIESKAAADLCPNNQRIRGLRAHVLLRLAQQEDVTTAGGRARAKALLVELNGLKEEAGARRWLGDLQEADNELPAALASYKRAAALAPSDGAIGAAVARLEKRNAIEGHFASREQNHFRAFFEGVAQERLAFAALDLLEHAYFDVGQQVGLYPVDPIDVVIYTGDQFTRATGSPDWSRAIFDGRIRLREGDIDAKNGFLAPLLRHEYVHAVLSRSIAAPLPGWLHEGLAQHFEVRNLQWATSVATRAARANALPALSELQTGFSGISDPDAAQAAYAYAYAFVEYLIAKRGAYAAQTFLGAMKAGVPLERAFRDTWVRSIGELDTEFRRTLE